jgi:hypothetical protein
MHFTAYLALSLLPVIGFRNRHHGIATGLSMFVLGVLMDLAGNKIKALPIHPARSRPV